MYLIGLIALLALMALGAFFVFVNVLIRRHLDVPGSRIFWPVSCVLALTPFLLSSAQLWLEG